MKKQQGMTLIGMVLTMAVVVLAAIVVMRIVPVEIEYFSIVSSIKGLSQTPASSLTGDPATDVMVLRESLNKRLDVNNINELKEDQVKFLYDGPNKYKVKLNYQAVRPLVYNISLLFTFNDTIEVNIAGEH